MSLTTQIEEWTMVENVADRLDEWDGREEGCDPTFDEIAGDVRLLEQQHEWLMKRVAALEGFALEALNRMNWVIFTLPKEADSDDLKALQDFVYAHNNGGAWVLDELKLDPDYSTNWGGDG